MLDQPTEGIAGLLLHLILTGQEEIYTIDKAVERLVSILLSPLCTMKHDIKT